MGQRGLTFFIAHGGRDTERATELRNHLHPDIPVFLDACDLLPGDEWDVELPRRQRQALATVALVSAGTGAAYYLREEIANAIAYQRSEPDKHRLIPVFLDGMPNDPSLIPYGMRVRHSLDAARLGMSGVADELRRTAAMLSGAAPPTRPPAIPGAADRTEMFDRLCTLLPSQFDEVLRRVGAPREHVAPANVSLAMRVIDLIQWVEQEGGPRTARLREALRELNRPPPAEVDAHTIDVLTRLLPPQFEDVIGRTGAPREHLSGSQAPRAIRVNELVQWAQQSADNRDRLRDAVVPARDRRGARPRATTEGRWAAAGRPVGLFANEEKPAFEFTGLDATGSSRSPIVIAIEERDAPLDESELLKTHRHLTVTLDAASVQRLREIDARITRELGVGGIASLGRAAWEVFHAAQPRLQTVLRRVVDSGVDQPIAWTGRTDLLLALHRTVQILRPRAGDDLGGFLSVACGAHYFSPLDRSRGTWTVQARSAGEPTVGVIELSEPPLPPIGEVAASDVAVLLGADLTSAMRPVVDAAVKGCTRVAVAIGGVDLTPALLQDVLARIPCFSVGGPTLGDEALLDVLKAGFATLAGRHAVPSVLAAVRKAWLELEPRAEAALLDALFWTTWSWVGRPLFATEFGELAPALVAHLMDLRSVAGKGWYFNRSNGIPKRYRADELATLDLPAKKKVHLYVSGAGGTGKSCFLRYVYEQLADRAGVIPVWYRVDAPNSTWDDVQRRLVDEITAAASREDKLGEAGKTLLPPETNLGSALRQAAKRLANVDGRRWEIVIFIDQLERTFESGDEPDQVRLSQISEAVINLLTTVRVGEGVRVFIASRKQYLPDFLRSFEAATEAGLHFNVLQPISDSTERTAFIARVLRWCREENLIEPDVDLDPGLAATIAEETKGHPLNLMLALIQLLSEEWHGQITRSALDGRPKPWQRRFHLDLRAMAEDDIDWYFALAMAQARTEIVRFEEVWWRLRMVDPTLTRRVDDLTPPELLERLWLRGHLGRTIHPRPYLNDPARFFEFFHANLRDYLLSEVMAQAGTHTGLLDRRCETPAAWRALERLSNCAHEWDQLQQLLPFDDVRVLIEHRDAVWDTVRWRDERALEPFHLLFLRDEASIRPALCTAARECLALSALVHDQLGRRAVETLFPDVTDRTDGCLRWLRRAPAEHRAPVLRYLIQAKEEAARTAIASIVVPSPDAEPFAVGLTSDLAQLLTEPLHVARVRNDLVAAVFERAVGDGVPASIAELPERVRAFVATACGRNRNDLALVLAQCAKRFAGSQREQLRRFSVLLAGHDVAEAWFTGEADAVATPVEIVDIRERQERPIRLILGAAVRTAVKNGRASGWHAEVTKRLGVALPAFEIGAGEVESDEIELRVHGERTALGSFHPDRVQVLKRHWERTQPEPPADAYDAQNDALDEVVLWLRPEALSQIGWELPAPDLDAAVVDWLEVLLRRSFGDLFDLLPFANELARRHGVSGLFQGIQVDRLRHVLVELVAEGVPLPDGGLRVLQHLHTFAKVKDPEVALQKVREQVRDDLNRAHADDAGQLSTLMVDERYENWLCDQVGPTNEGPALILDLMATHALVSTVRRQFERNLRDDVRPVVVCVTKLRAPLARLLRLFDPRVHVLSFSELSQEIIPVPAGLIEPPDAGLP